MQEQSRQSDAVEGSFPDFEPTLYERYVQNLGLLARDFYNKKILDVGSDTAEFARVAKQLGISDQVYSLERRPVLPEERTKAVQGQAERLPFKDGSFDLVISHYSVPNQPATEDPDYERAKEKVLEIFEEMLRVTAPGGEIRMAGVPMDREPLEEHRLFVQRKAVNRSAVEAFQAAHPECAVEVVRLPLREGASFESPPDSENIVRQTQPEYRIIIRKPAK